MTARKTKAKAGDQAEGKPDNALHVPRHEGETQYRATAKALLAPEGRHGMTAVQLFKSQLGDSGFAPGIGDYAAAIGERAKSAESGDLAFVSRMLAAQAMTLDSIFSEMARRMAMNMGEYLGATETYARIALKAQAGSRATLEALTKLHQPREQTVRHVHVNEGGQAMIADHFHHHAGALANHPMVEQPHTPASGVALDELGSGGDQRGR